LAGTLGVALSAHADTRARFMAANCSYCHGPDGKSHGAIPSLAGLEPGYFVEQMKGFRDGSRPATVMKKHANGTPTPNSKRWPNTCRDKQDIGDFHHDPQSSRFPENLLHAATAATAY
jgi:hypothetical protein